MSSNTTNVSNATMVGVIRYAAYTPREIRGALQVKLKSGKLAKTWPYQPKEAGQDERLDTLARKVLGKDAEASKYAAVNGRYIHRTDGPTIVVTDERPTHLFFVTDHGLRAYGGVNNFDVINVDDKCHIVAIPLNKADQAIKNNVFE